MSGDGARWDVRRLEPADDIDRLLAGTLAWPGAERVAPSFVAAAGTASRQVVATERGRVIGYAHCLTTPLAEGRRAAGHVWVDPPSRGRGVGTALWAHVLDGARLAGLAGVRVGVDPSDVPRRDVARGHGLALGPVRRESLLDLTTLSPAVVEAALARLTPEVRVAAFAGGGDREWRDLYQSFVPLHEATPDAAGGREPPPFASWRDGFCEPWQVLVALRGEATVGMTMAFARPDLASRVVTNFTGVVDAERGRGVATALKAEHARRLANAGWKELTTWNMETNTAILAANARLGFVPLTRMQALTYDFP